MEPLAVVLADRGCGLEGHTEDDRGAVGNPAVHAAGTVLQRTIGPEGVIVLRALHRCGGKTVAEFYSTDPRYGEDRMGNQGFHAVPKRLSQAGREPAERALHNPAKGVTFLLGLRYQFSPSVRIAASSHTHQTSLHAEIRETVGKYLLCHHSGRNYSHGKPS